MPQSYPLERRGRLQDFPGGPEVDSLLSMQGVQAPFLVGELRSHMPWDVAKNLFFFKEERGPYSYPQPTSAISGGLPSGKALLL